MEQYSFTYSMNVVDIKLLMAHNIWMYWGNKLLHGWSWQVLN